MHDEIFLSPHLDDAALSCGGRIAHQVAAGGHPLVVNVFTADEPAEPPSRLAANLARWWRLRPGEVMKRRRQEDAEALRRLGVPSLNLDVDEAPYRLSARGRAFYRKLSALSHGIAPEDAARTVPEIAERLRSLPPHRRLIVPLGVGRHVDHLLVRAAAESTPSPLAYYEDFPYVAWKRFALRRQLGLRRRWQAECLKLDAGLFETKLRSILAYESQVQAMFRDEKELRDLLKSQMRRSGGERLWTRASPR